MSLNACCVPDELAIRGWLGTLVFLGASGRVAVFSGFHMKAIWLPLETVIGVVILCPVLGDLGGRLGLLLKIYSVQGRPQDEDTDHQPTVWTVLWCLV